MMQAFNIVFGMMAALVFTVMAFFAVGLFGMDPEDLQRMGLLDHGREILYLNQFEWRVVLLLVGTALGFMGFVVGRSGFKLLVVGLLLGMAVWAYFLLDVQDQMLVDVRFLRITRLILVAGAVMGATLLLAKLGLAGIAGGSIQREMGKQEE